MKPRFFISNSEERYDSPNIVIDSETGRELGSDGGEPEDNSLYRDWAWVLTELNSLAAEIEQLKQKRTVCEHVWQAHLPGTALTCKLCGKIDTESLAQDDK